MKYLLLTVICLNVFFSCQSKNKIDKNILTQNSLKNNSTLCGFITDSTPKIIHVFVALCDNKFQGIVPVPKAIGNGQNPSTNLYWGCEYGIKTYFTKKGQWQLLKSYTKSSVILERLVFKHKHQNAILVADAYDGQFIKNCTVDFLNSTAGKQIDTLQVGNKIYGINGKSSLLSYIGHDGLMDFELPLEYNNVDSLKRDVIILACISKKYFEPYINQANANALVWSTGFMSPEAYTLHSALEEYLNNKPKPVIVDAAAKAYAKYQKCSVKAAKGLLVN